MAHDHTMFCHKTDGQLTEPTQHVSSVTAADKVDCKESHLFELTNTPQTKCVGLLTKSPQNGKQLFLNTGEVVRG